MAACRASALRAAVFRTTAARGRSSAEWNGIRMSADRVAFITGGSRGIGRGSAERLLADGYLVAISGRDPGKGEQALREMAAGERAIFLAAGGGAQGPAGRGGGGGV